MIRGLSYLLALATTASCVAQERPHLLSSQRQPFAVSTSAGYQVYERTDAPGTDSELPARITELSFPIFVLVPLNRSLSLSLAASQATVVGESLESLSGFSDAQVTITYARRLGRGSVVASVGANLPSGKHELTRGEFATAVPLSYGYYDFRVPGLGQGLGVSPRFTFAYPVGDALVLGAGASYFYRGAFEPLQNMENGLDPGDEILITGGFDVALGGRSTFAGDITYTIYGRDRVGGDAVYGAGDKMAVSVRVRRYLRRYDVFRLVGRYRTRGRSDLRVSGELVSEANHVLPDQTELQGTYEFHVSSIASSMLLVRGRLFEATSYFSEVRLIDVGVMPALRLSSSLTLSSTFIYTLGDIEGYEIRGGLMLRL